MLFVFGLSLLLKVQKSSLGLTEAQVLPRSALWHRAWVFRKPAVAAFFVGCSKPVLLAGLWYIGSGSLGDSGSPAT